MLANTVKNHLGEDRSAVSRIGDRDAAIIPAIVIVDDDEAIRDSLKWLLESAGYEVSCFNSARHFLDTIVEGRPACVVVDIDMPAMTGIEFVPLFRRRYLDVPVVFLTDDIEGRLARRAAALEPAGLFAKPLDTHSLLSRIREVGG